MVFTSFSFLIFLPLAAACLYLTPARWRWVVLLACNWYYYLSWDVRYGLVLGVVTAVTYVCALGMAGVRGRRRRRAFFLAGLLGNLGLLAAFKYGRFLASLSLVPADGLDAVLPVGISFYVFQSLAYLFEVHKGAFAAERHPGYLAAYVSFFPQILAGPIARPGHLLPQLRAPAGFDGNRVGRGLALFGWGMFKKAVVADRLAGLVGTVYADPAGQGGPVLWGAVFFYAVQIYADFSGYTDMALGVAQVVGVELPPNFDRPYLARSIRDFWRRWHMSLSSWYRDYLYIPMGGNRLGTVRTFFNVMMVFVLCGAWHGAGVKFLVWGGLHGFYIIFGAVTAPARERLAEAVGLAARPRLRRVIQSAVTFALVALAWIPFRAVSLEATLAVFTGLGHGLDAFWQPRELRTMFLAAGWDVTVVAGALLAVAVLGLSEALLPHGDLRRFLAGRPAWQRWMLYYALVAAVFHLGVNNTEFIYFQF